MTDYATLLRDHVPLKIRSIDRVLLQGYVPKLQTVGYVCRFLRWQRNFPVPFSAPFCKIGQPYVRAVHRFAEEHNIPRLKFEKGQDKEKIALPYLQFAAGKVKIGLSSLDGHKKRPPSGYPGPAKVRKKPPIPTLTGGDRWPTSIIFTFTCGINNGVGPSARPTPMLLFPSGFGSTAMNGPNVS